MSEIEKDVENIQAFNEGKKIGIELGRQQMIDLFKKLDEQKEAAFAKELEERYQKELIRMGWAK